MFRIDMCFIVPVFNTSVTSVHLEAESYLSIVVCNRIRVTTFQSAPISTELFIIIPWISKTKEKLTDKLSFNILPKKT